MKVSAQEGGLEAVWYGRSAGAAAARVALAPASVAFAAAARLRGLLYDRGLLAAGRAPAPVVSVGALRVGGAGKTPFVLWLVAALEARGLRPAIVTRGYGAASGKDTPELLTPEMAAAPGAAERFGDESLLLALRSGSTVAVGRDRLAACRLAAQSSKPDLFLLDDGFQHRRLLRDLDIVLVSGSEEQERLLPAGPLREPVASLARASLVVEMDSGRNIARSGRIAARTTPVSLVADVRDTQGEPVSALAGRRVVAVAAIARPARFIAALEALGAEVVQLVLRRDHHRYGSDDCRAIASAARGADLVVTTEKDLVKLAPLALALPLRALRVEVRVDDAARVLAAVETLRRV